MIILLAFLAALFVFGLLAFVLTNGALRGDLRKDGPGPIAQHVRGRNRLLLGILLALLVAVALLEYFVPGVHLALQGLQYDLGSYDPVGVYTTALGGGVSWGLYLGLLLGALTGLVAGSYAACRRHDHAQSVAPLHLA